MKPRLYSILLGFCFIHANAASIRGIVTGKGSYLPVPGATIELVGKHRSTVSDPYGFFSFGNLPEGTYPLKITAVGFWADSLSCVVEVGNRQVLHIALTERVTVLDSVVVSGSVDPGSQAYGRTLEKQSIPLVGIISRQSIEQSADITVADAIQRACGVSMAADQSGALTKAIIRGMDTKYSYVSVNSVALPSPDDRSRYLALNLFPANSIERLEIYKTLTPAMPGNAIGGWVNMVTREVPAKQRFSVRLATGYNDLFLRRDFLSFNHKVVQHRSPYEKYGSGYYAKGTDFTSDNLSFRTQQALPDMQASLLWGNKFFHEKLGVMVSAGMQHIQEGSNSFFIEQNNEPQLDNAPGITDFTKRRYSISSRRKNVYAQVDYQLNNRHRFRVNQLYTWKEDLEARHWVDTSLAEGRSGLGTGRIAFAQRSRVHDQSLYHIHLQGDHRVGEAWAMAWSAVYARAYGAYPDWAEYGANTGRIRGANGTVTQTPVLLAPLNRIWMHNSENEKAVSADVSYAPETWQALKLKAGTLLQYRNRTNFYNQYIFNPAYTESGGQPFTDIYHAVWYDSDGPQNPLGNVHTPGTYTGNERISAFFAELDMKVDRLDIITGVRSEYTRQGVASSVPPTDDLGQQVGIHYLDWLPSLHIRYALSSAQNLRFAYYQALSRPALYDVTYFNMNYDDYAVAGNPFLKRSTAANFDLRYEQYLPGVLDELQVTAFYKRLKNPYEKTLLNASDMLYPIPSGGLSYTPATKITEQLRNFDRAVNYGLDLSVAKSFGNISLVANYTFTASHVTQRKKFKQREIPNDVSSDIVTVTRMQTRPLQGQSRHVANAYIGYHLLRWGLNPQLTGIYTGKRIENVSGWYDMDNWQKGYVLVNASLEKTFNRRWQIFANVNNLLNAAPVVYMNRTVTGVPQQRERGKLVVEKTERYRQFIVGVAATF